MSEKKQAPARGGLGVPPGWVRRVIDRGVQQAKLILRVSNFYADAIESKSGGSAPDFPEGVSITGLPTSSTGLAVGTLWNDSGTVKVKL